MEGSSSFFLRKSMAVIFPFSQLLSVEGQLDLVALLFAMLEPFVGGYQQYLLRLVPIDVSMEHGMLAYHPR